MTSEGELKPITEIMPEQIELNDLESSTFESLFSDIGDYVKKGSELQGQMQQLQQMAQQVNADFLGTQKAIEKFIQIILKQKNIAGRFVWDPEKKMLVRQKEQLSIPMLTRR